MPIFCLKSDNLFKPVDFGAQNLDLDGRVIFTVDQDAITYYFCTKQKAGNNQALQWQLRSIQMSGSTPNKLLSEYRTYDPQKKHLSDWITDIDFPQAQLNLSHFFNNDEKARVIAFYPIIQKIVQLQFEQQEQDDEAMQTSFDEVVNKRYHQYALKILLASLESLDPNKIKETLAAHWQRIKNNQLSYTTLSNDFRYISLIQLFCDIAVMTAKLLNTAAIELLMPGITLKSQYEKSFPNLNEPYLNDTSEALQGVLKSHIVGNQGRCLVPVKLLDYQINPLTNVAETIQAVSSPIEIQNSQLQKVINPYYDATENEPTPSKGNLDKDTIDRLRRFAPSNEPISDQKVEYNETVPGKDKLGLTHEMLKFLEIDENYHIHTINDLFDLMQSIPEEITQLSLLPGRSEEIIAVLRGKTVQSGLENLISLITTYSDQQVIALFRANAHGLFGSLGIISDANTLDEILKQMRPSMRESMLELINTNILSFVKTVDALIIFLDCNHLTVDQRTVILDAVKEKLGTLIQHGYKIRDLMDCKYLTDAQRTVIWDAVKENLGTLIQDDIDLRALLNCEKITHDQRTIILDAVKTKLGTVIQYGYKPHDLLGCEKLTANQRMIIWEAVKEKLGILIQNDIDLRDLLSCSKLTVDQRTEILEAVKEKIGTWIQDATELRDLLDCNHLTVAHRTIIWEAVEERIDTLIRNEFDLYNLLDFYKLTADQHWKIWCAVKEKLGILIQDGYKLGDLLRYYTIGVEQRTAIWDAVKDKLGTLIQNGNILSELLDWDNLTADQCAVIWEAVKEKFGTLIQNGCEISKLMSSKRLTADQRSVIWEAVNGNFDTLIRNGHEIGYLMSCDNLTDEQRTVIWEAVKNKLGTLIKNGEQIGYLMNCNKLTDNQRMLIWETVKKNLGAFIQNGYDITNLMNCNKLTVDQPTVIWEAVKEKLGTSIQNGFELFCVLNLDKLTDDQRTVVWEAVKENLGTRIQCSYSLVRLLDCDKLTADQRTVIWEAVKNKIGALMHNSFYYHYLLNSNKFTAEQRTVIWEAAKEKLDTLIESERDLRFLLQHDTITTDQRSVILESVKERLGTLIQYPGDLYDILKCDKLSVDQRTVILESVKEKLSALVKNSGDLHQLLRCDTLTADQRTIILKSVKEKLGTYIQDHSELFSLLKYFSDLTDDHRRIILDAVKQTFGTWNYDVLAFSNLLEFIKLVDVHRTDIWLSLQPEFLKRHQGEMKNEEIQITPQRLSSPDLSSQATIQQSLKDIIEEYTIRILSEPGDFSCCLSFFSPGTPLIDKRSAAIKMLKQLEKSGEQPEPLTPNEVSAIQNGRLKQVYGRLLELGKINSNSLSCQI